MGIRKPAASRSSRVYSSQQQPARSSSGSSTNRRKSSLILFSLGLENRLSVRYLRCTLRRAQRAQHNAHGNVFESHRVSPYVQHDPRYGIGPHSHPTLTSGYHGATMSKTMVQEQARERQETGTLSVSAFATRRCPSPRPASVRRCLELDLTRPQADIPHSASSAKTCLWSRSCECVLKARSDVRAPRHAQWMWRRLVLKQAVAHLGTACLHALFPS